MNVAAAFRLFLASCMLVDVKAFSIHHRHGILYPARQAQVLHALTDINKNDVSREDFEWDQNLKEDVDNDEVSNSQEHQDDDDDDVSVKAFVDMILQAPGGSLDQEEIGLLRQVMTSIANENYGEDISTPETVEKLLYRLVSEWEAVVADDEREVDAGVQPTADDFLVALQAWERMVGSNQSRRNTNAMPVAIQSALKLLATQEKVAARGVEDAKPRVETYLSVMKVLTSSREKGVDRKVWDIYQSMERRHGLQSNPDVYHYVVTALAKSKDHGAANRAEKILREAATKFPPGINGKGEATGVRIDSFNVILTAWAKSGLEYGPERAEKLIVYMDELDTQNGGHRVLRPSVYSFTSLIDAYGQTNTWEGVGNAERILNQLLDQYLEGEEPDLEPTVASWTIVISAWARLSKKNFKGAANRAFRLLKRMEKLHDEKRISFAPDAIVYVTCMNAFAFSKLPDGPEKAEELLNEMHERYLDGDDSMKPSLKSIRIIIDAWIKSTSPDAMDRAEAFLDRYEDMLMEYEDTSEDFKDAITDIYRSMLFGWTKCGDPELAQKYLVDIIENDLEIDSFCFDKIIEANTQSFDEGALRRTEEVFRLMEQCASEGKLQPNERVYTSYIRALTKGKVDNLAQKAFDVVGRMNDLYQDGNNAIQPTVFTYNAVLMACAESSTAETAERMNALKIAVTVFNELRSGGGQPDHVTFGNMIRCANLVPDEQQRRMLIQSTFQLCCKQGFVNSFVVRDLINVASEEHWRALLHCPEGDVEVEDLPASWRSKIVDRKPRTPPSRRR